MTEPKGKPKAKNIDAWLSALPDEYVDFVGKLLALPEKQIDLLKKHKKLLEDHIKLLKNNKDLLKKNIGLLKEKETWLVEVMRREGEFQKIYG